MDYSELGSEVMASPLGPVLKIALLVVILLIVAAIGLLLLTRFIDGCQAVDKWFYKNILGWKDEDVDGI
jgi:hypothetical protein